MWQTRLPFMAGISENGGGAGVAAQYRRGNFDETGSFCASPASEHASAHATQTWCATVRQDVSDGYLNLRARPSAGAPVLAKLLPGDFLEISTGQCDYGYDAARKIAGNVCAPAGSKWVPVEFVKRFDDGSYSREEHGGWINEHYVDQVACDWD